MANILARRTLGVSLGVGSVLLLCVVVGVQGQQPADRPAGTDKPAAARQAAETVHLLREDLKARHAKIQELQIQQVRLKAEVEIELIAIRAAEERLNEAMTLLRKKSVPPQTAQDGRPLEQRLQQLDRQIQALTEELKALREIQKVARFTPLDFQELANQKRKDNIGSDKYPGNTLESLSAGEHRFLDVPFRVGEGLLQVGSTELQDKPAKITGIKVGKKLTNLHFLHATAYFLEEEVPIGSYTVHYAEGKSETIPIVNSKDVTDWWKYPFSKAPTTGKVAWEGANAGAKTFDATLWLFLSTWKNPRPNILVTSIDFVSTMDTRCAPFCVAITAEEP